MDKLKAMRVFVRIVDTGSLTAAAAAGGQSPASVVRTLAALEQALGVRLLNRSTRRLALTDEGRDYLARCRHILAALDEAEAVLSAGQLQPAGSLGVTAPVTFGRRHVAPLLSEFLAGHDGLRGELVLLDRVVNLVEEGLDLAVRIGQLADSSLVAVPLGHTRHVVCASPALLARLGRPARPEALEGCPGIWFGPQGGRWPFLADGEVLEISLAPALVSNQVDAVREACRQGLGYARLYHYQVADDLAEGRLEVVLDACETSPVPVQLVYPHARLMSLRVRSFVQWVTPRLRQVLAA